MVTYLMCCPSFHYGTGIIVFGIETLRSYSSLSQSMCDVCVWLPCLPSPLCVHHIYRYRYIVGRFNGYRTGQRVKIARPSISSFPSFPQDDNRSCQIPVRPCHPCRLPVHAGRGSGARSHRQTFWIEAILRQRPMRQLWELGILWELESSWTLSLRDLRAAT